MAFQEKLCCLDCLYLIKLFLLVTILPIGSLISCAVYICAYLVSCFFPNYGQFISYTDVFLDEDFVNSNPQSSIVISLDLQGDICLPKLRTVFTENVLKARSQVNPDNLRYPQLKQFLTTFLLYRIWKNDPNFCLENHIVDRIWNGEDPENIHQEYLNQPFKKDRSPWELILIRNNNLDDSCGKELTSIIVFRVHHVMADAKSLLKLLVECLGNQKLTTARPRYIRETRTDFLRFILCFPFNYICDGLQTINFLHKSFQHPWKFKGGSEKSNVETNKTVISFSSKIVLSDLKEIAIKNNVTTSAVAMSIIAGAIMKVIGTDWDTKVAIGYPLPKPNHPECLTNHMYMTILHLPTDQVCEIERLQECDRELIYMKNEQKGRYLNFAAVLAGFQIYPIHRMFINAFGPLGITNNAGEDKGFFVGTAKCVDFRMSVGTMQGPAGVAFCTMSYKDGIRIAVIAKESILSKKETQILTNQMETELQLLLKTGKQQ